MKWQKSILNMVWYALDNAGTGERARHMIESILFHVSNVHSFPHLQHFPTCLHQELSPRLWIGQGSPAWRKLKSAIFGKNGRNLDDLDSLVGSGTTSGLESVNSLLLKYAPKTHSYSWLSMHIKSCVAAIDFNWNVDRPLKVNEAGNLMYRKKVDRGGTVCRAIPVRVDKSDTWQDKIMEACLEALENDSIPVVEYPIDTRLEKAEREKREHLFPKEVLIEAQKARMIRVADAGQVVFEPEEEEDEEDTELEISDLESEDEDSSVNDTDSDSEMF